MVKISIPATSGNLGPGFDTFGMAFNLYNYVSMEEATSGLNITVQGEGAESISRGEDNLVFQAAHKVFQKVNFFPKGLKISLENNIPVARGLGSSASIIVGGMVAANQISGEKLSKNEILQMAVEMEGHPDNVAPALLGGVVVSVSDDKQVDYVKIAPPDELYAVVAVPNFELSTKIARAALPNEVSLSDAVFNVGRASLMIAALIKKDLFLFGKMMEDRLHQPYRNTLVPGMEEVFSAAKSAGALSVALSGAGPTLIAFTIGKNQDVAEAMSKTFAEHEISCEIMNLNPDVNGVKVISS